MFVAEDTFARLCAARDRLADPDETRSVREIARRAGISQFHFIRQMEALFGSTPHQLRVRARLEAAKRELGQGQRSVTEVCMELGFSSLGSFSGAFSRRVGVSPSCYRARARVQVAVPEQLVRPELHDCLGLMAALPADAFRNFGEASRRAGMQGERA